MSIESVIHPTISSSDIPFSSGLQSFQALGSFPMSQFFTSGGQSIKASASVLPMNIQDWFPLGWTDLISLQSKGLSRVFSSNCSSKASILRCSTFFMVQLSHPYMTTGKTIALARWTFAGKVLSQWNYEPCCVGPPHMDRLWWRVPTKRGTLKKGMANHFSILAWRTPRTVRKGKKVEKWKINSSGC